MARQSVRLASTALSSAEWDDETLALIVAFTSGQSYTFENVPQSVFEGLASARSPGQYYHQNIKGMY